MKTKTLIYTFLIVFTTIAPGAFVKSFAGIKLPSKIVTQQVVDKVNINTASAKEIAEYLSGIGMKKALAIVEYREKNGQFKKLEDLAAVKGIGIATLVKNKKKIQLN
ncbi:ComEA family DNA-binding protein [Aliikangiella maris]|uniref:Helix-hairpin-helix domain-containing protein n=2 Tax=Aliikangiella maris TaxID=3162458 RepID=A0ABV2BP26_9GAMM